MAKPKLSSHRKTKRDAATSSAHSREFPPGHWIHAMVTYDKREATAKLKMKKDLSEDVSAS
jgi:hypothetical protein